MRKRLWPLLVMLLCSSGTFAAGTQYELRVDGLSCPFCAYGIEKQFKKTAGVESVAVDIERGVVVVKTGGGVTLSNQQLRRLVKEAGFTLKSLSEKPLP